MRGPFLAFLVASSLASSCFAASCLAPSVARAEGGPEEDRPLLLRIRPGDDTTGAGGQAALARAAREAVWERANRRAHLAIASVCSGCLGPWPRASSAAAEAPPSPPIAGDP